MTSLNGTMEPEAVGPPDNRIRLGLLGSCVSRDPLKHAGQDIDIAWYQARTCIPSMGTGPINLTYTFTEDGTGAFERRNFQFDLAKQWKVNIKRDDYDVLLIDFIDERFGCGRVGYDYFTNSSTYRKSVVLAEGQKERVTKLYAPISAEYRDLVAHYLDRVLDEIASVAVPILCNNVYWTWTREDGSPDTEFPQSRFEPANHLLDLIYDKVRRYPNIRMLDVPKQRLVARVNHHWGDAPFHYTDDVDQAIAERIVEMARQPR